MRLNRRILLASTAAAGVAALGLGAAKAQDTIKIGEINSYSGMPGFTQPYKKAWELALEEINKKGGVLGKKLEVIARDDSGKPGEAVKIAEEMVVNDKVVMLGGTFLSHIGLAVTDFAAQKKVFFLAAEPLADQVVWQKGNRYTFRLRASTNSQAMMLVEAAKKSKAKKWATIAPNYAYGQDAVKSFIALLKKARPDIQIVAQQWPALGRIDAGAEVQALLKAAPDGIYNVTFGGDLAKFVKEGNARGLFKGKTVVSLLTGEPEYADPLGADMPDGWIVTGYPWSKIKTPAHEAFLKAYQAKYNDYPRLGSIVGYTWMYAAAGIIQKAGKTDTESLIKAARGIKLNSPMGPYYFRAIDQQSTLGAYVGLTTVENGKPTMKNWYYADGAKYQPTDAEVKKLRPAEAMK
ncbi:MAG: ABC transporter substrate-binding protein [Rhodospirillaceae bacterium]|nr:ABC transporter substrate-binding protein [Rhodospirillaceae bacterium]